MAFTKAQEQAFEAIAAQLRAISGTISPPGGPVTWEKRTDLALPLDPSKMDLTTARDTIDRVIEAESAYNDYSFTYNHRPHDGAVATAKVLRTLYGQVLGKKTWFQDPEQISVQIAPGDGNKVNVPWGLLQLPAIPFGSRAVLNIGATRDPVYGTVLCLNVKALKSAEGEVNALFILVNKELHDHSIYRGQAITASDQPQFIDLTGVRLGDVVFAEHTERRLDFRLFSVVEKEHIYIELGEDGKQIIWLYGDYGVGKSEILKELAKRATDRGWTVAQMRSGVDTWDQLLQLAKLYAPRFIGFVEDAESVTGTTDAGEVAKMLDQLDGTESKLLKQCVFVFTTNFIDKVQKAATRPGRADAIIRLGNLDRAGCERLAGLVLGDMLADGVDFDAIYAAMGGAVLEEGGLPMRNDKGEIVFKPEADLTPAFMRKAYMTAQRRAALGGGLHAKVNTDDILDGIIDMEEQLLIHRQAPEPKPRENLSAALAEALRPMVREIITRQLNDYSSTVYDVTRDAADSVVEHRIHGAKINRESNGETWAVVATN